ncbi:LysM peptidoglycan-binding domain-containing protein [Nocardia sp. 348MFTsu5.1]|uniref:LysM peptidoglycan-binding domain-containing protein n=1 Tax=Nocardia sp. 348MFTsu5.1 TaxID=1172185 RepID=UPI00036840AF|nr:LysM peptidoglycan-binding domain-containing protein [Nocardia sp. 348MFTsu5.1]
MATNYTVVPGDTLWDIAIRFYGRGELFPVIADANHLPNPDLIFPGQQLLIPDLAPPPTPPVPPPPDPPTEPKPPELPAEPIDFRLLRTDDLVDLDCTAVGFVIETPAGPGVPEPPRPPTEVRYTVVPGDTLWDIAARFYGDPRRYPEIVAANAIPNPDLIFPGQVFLIPGIAGPPGPAPEVPVVDPTRHLRAVADDAHIVVRFGPQNIYEERFPGTPAGQPSKIFAARESRVVFGVPVGTRIEFSTAGVLRALPLFALNVSPSASARPEDGAPPVELPDRPAPLTERETAIEAPFRLIVSPSPRGAFHHPIEPYAALDDSARIELWTTRLAVRREVDGVLTEIDQKDQVQRIVRALHTRNDDPGQPPIFEGSLKPEYRADIVALTSHRTDEQGAAVEPEPLAVRKLVLSAVGAWIDWSAKWDPTPANRILAYRHLAPMGRDAYVRVDIPGLLYPFGHAATLVDITERQIKPGPNPVATLIKRQFIVVREPTRTYRGAGSTKPFAMPFTEMSVRPLVTPDIKPVAGVAPFVAEVEGFGNFRWRMSAIDHAKQIIEMETPLVFVPLLHVDTDAKFTAVMTAAAAAWTPTVRSELAILDKDIAMAPQTTAGDTTFRTESLGFEADADAAARIVAPRLAAADLVVPALSALNGGAAPVSVTYDDDYAAKGFAAGGPAEVFLTLVTPTRLDFGGGSDKGGGFVQPNVGIAALSRTLGAIGDKNVTAGSPLANGKFDPAAFLGGAGAKLFGLFSLLDIVQGAGLDRAPELVSEALDLVSGLRSEVSRLSIATDSLTADLAVAIAKDTSATGKDQLQVLADTTAALKTQLPGAAEELAAAFEALLAGKVADAIGAADRLKVRVSTAGVLIASPHLPAASRAMLEKPYNAVQHIIDVASNPDVVMLVKALTATSTGVLRFDWTPPLGPWPKNSSGNQRVFIPSPNGLTISAEVRTGDAPGSGIDVSAQLTDFELALLPGAELMAMRFTRMGFRVASGRKPEIDVVFGGLEFRGPLEFIEKLRQVIPFDGFSDPPFVDISPGGVKAGFELALPSIPLGVFNLENIALLADCHVPFIGEAVTVGFGFCRKEAPFRLTVMAIGGGGWVGIRLSPAGLVLLEMGLEAGAALSLDFGVASGSVSVMIGIYLRLEGERGQLTGYFRIRGEVDVLGLASASLTLELSLTYDTFTGKLVGRASLVLEVEVLFFSASVEVTVERRLAGSRGDPSLRDIMPPERGGNNMWDNYFDAFAIGA